jgi:hypothetical protein
MRGALFKKYLLVLPHFPLIDLNKILFTTVVGTFNVIGKETCGKLASTLVVAETFTTESFSAAWIATVTRVFVFLYLAVCHNYYAPTNFLNSFSSMIVTPSFFAFAYFEPGSVPTTT